MRKNKISFQKNEKGEKEWLPINLQTHILVFKTWILFVILYSNQGLKSRSASIDPWQ